MIICLFGLWALCIVYKGRTKRWAFDGSHEWKLFVLVMSFPYGWALAWPGRNSQAPFILSAVYFYWLMHIAGLFVSFWLLQIWIWLLTQFSQNWGVPHGLDRNGAGRENGTVQNSAFKCQWTCVLWKQGKDEFVESDGRLQQCTACKVAVTKESTAGLWNRDWISLSPARFCCCWLHCLKCFALSCAILRSLELGLLAVACDSLPRKGWLKLTFRPSGKSLVWVRAVSYWKGYLEMQRDVECSADVTDKTDLTLDVFAGLG